MNPHMLYAQAIYGKVGRGIGLIDIPLISFQSVKVLEKNGGISTDEAEQIKSWFSEFLEWMTTHEYGFLSCIF